MMEKEYKRNKIKSRISWIIATLFAIIAAVIAITPFIFMIMNSFKEKFEMLTKGVFSLPDKLDFTNYKEVIEGNFLSYFVNSVIVLVVSLIILLMISAFASYPLSRFKFRFKAGIDRAVYSNGDSDFGVHPDKLHGTDSKGDRRSRVY